MAKAKSTSKKVATEPAKVLRDDQFSKTPAKPTGPRARLLEDLHFAAPELWPLHIDRAMEEAEAAAVAEERARLRAAVTELSGFDSFGNIELADVLALLDEP